MQRARVAAVTAVPAPAVGGAEMHQPARMTVAVRRRGRGRPAATAATGLRERAWWLMRVLGKPFTLDDLLFTLNDGTQADAHGNLSKYLAKLEIAGVLRRLKRRAAGYGPKSNGLVVWRLVRDLGPLAPVWRAKSQALWDPNGQQLIAPEQTPTDPSSTPDGDPA